MKNINKKVLTLVSFFVVCGSASVNADEILETVCVGNICLSIPISSDDNSSKKSKTIANDVGPGCPPDCKDPWP